MPDWQEIVSRDGDAVWRTAYRYLGNRADADECFQEAFLAAWELSRRQQVRNWRALLIRLAAARAVDRLRRRRFLTSRREAPDWEALKDRSPSPQQLAEDAELSERLRRLWRCFAATGRGVLPPLPRGVQLPGGCPAHGDHGGRGRCALTPGASACASCWVNRRHRGALPDLTEPLTGVWRVNERSRCEQPSAIVFTR